MISELYLNIQSNSLSFLLRTKKLWVWFKSFFVLNLCLWVGHSGIPCSKPLILALSKQKQVDLWVWSQHGLQSLFQDSQVYSGKPCLKKPKQNISDFGRKRLQFKEENQYGVLTWMITQSTGIWTLVFVSVTILPRNNTQRTPTEHTLSTGGQTEPHSFLPAILSSLRSDFLFVTGRRWSSGLLCCQVHCNNDQGTINL